MITHDCEQLSPEWFAVRLGKVTASNFGLAIAGGAGKTRKKYMLKLAAERLTGIPIETFTNATMQRGSDVEWEAREAYESRTGCKVQQVGFIEHDGNIGASTDGLVGKDGMLEIKDPFPSTHIETILNNRVPSTYKPQIQGGLWVAERKWCDFVSYDPRVISRPFWFKRVYRDDEYIKELRIKLCAFVKELLAIIEKIENPI